MIQQADQIFVLLKHWLVGFLPSGLQGIAGVLLSVVGILAVFPTLFALAVWMERKGLARMQNRRGPNRVGPFGLLQPIADAVKSLTKEDLVPSNADAAVHFLSPVLLTVVVFMGIAVLPMGRNMTLAPMDAGLLFFFAMGASTELAVFHGRLVEPQQILSAGRHARCGADDQLRGSLVDVERSRRDDHRLAFAG